MTNPTPEPGADPLMTAGDAVRAEVIEQPKKRDRRTGRPPGRPRKDGAPAGSAAAPRASSASAPPTVRPFVPLSSEEAKARADMLQPIGALALAMVARMTGTTAPTDGEVRELAEALAPVHKYYEDALFSDPRFAVFFPLAMFGITYTAPRVQELRAHKAERRAAREQGSADAAAAQDARQAERRSRNNGARTLAHGVGADPAPVVVPSGAVV